MPLRKWAGFPLCQQKSRPPVCRGATWEPQWRPATARRAPIRGRTRDPRACRARGLSCHPIWPVRRLLSGGSHGICLGNAIEDFSGEIVVGCIVKEIAIVPPDHTVYCVAQTRGAFTNCIENRLRVGRRTADNAEHFAGCRLMFESFGKIRVRACTLVRTAARSQSRSRLGRRMS